jgi:phytoene dehydrogenase-like protein
VTGGSAVPSSRPGPTAGTFVSGRGKPDAVVVGSGPNGLAAAIALAQAGRRVVVREAQPTPGGGLRTLPLTLPGYLHDVCSAVHPLAISSPFFRRLGLERFGLEWIHPAAPLAHPLDDQPAVIMERSLQATAANLGRDAESYRSLMEPFVARWDRLSAGLLAPPRLPPSPILLALFGRHAVRSAAGFARGRFMEERARALFAGNAAHSFLALEDPPSAAFGMVLGVAGHAAGWPIARGGSGALADALVALLRSLGGEVIVDAPVDDIDEVLDASIVMLDLTPPELLRIAGHRLPAGYRRQLERFVPGPGVFKLDWALDGPIPWRDPAVARAGTVHVCGTLGDVCASEAAPGRGEAAERPFVLLAQPSLFDATRAPAGRHTGWAYCHVPLGSTADMTDRIERQVERFAPGFRDRILARKVSTPRDVAGYNRNMAGGDISGGALDLKQILFRPAIRWNPYTTPLRNVFVCSASTPPGPGVHGMSGWYAAKAALRS